ncbi:lytic transglycosylase domain-containing protein [Dictyobacter kobayashii]|uniref:Transglycosylase SLT domain-containing protein n=1 Tax=Dictyobacter kobayashii TaxID=2014872 RepID=A0A402AYB1_9CHLR|nr:lytic transglycosylase domain-containing protein [Dictyobacter kobayashii]GCE24043.1 hypothetical protein KDK_78430 [Dictyobacter kobayashii]
MTQRLHSSSATITTLDSKNTGSTTSMNNNHNVTLQEPTTQALPKVTAADLTNTYQRAHQLSERPSLVTEKLQRASSRRPSSGLRKGIAVGATCCALLLSVFSATHFSQVQTTGSVASYRQPNVASTIQHDHHRHQAVAHSYIDTARSYASAAGINPDTFVRQIQQESGFNPGAQSPVGAIGIAQFMPATAASMGFDPTNPDASLKAAANWMADLNRQFGGDYAKALAAYNAGPGAVQGAMNSGGANWLAQLPAETQNYVHSIMG